jgi:hypothetical protein
LVRGSRAGGESDGFSRAAASENPPASIKAAKLRQTHSPLVFIGDQFTEFCVF